MNMVNKNIFDQDQQKSLLDYVNIIRNKIISVVVIFFIVLFVSIAYAYSRADIYSSVTTLKISQPQENILDSPLNSALGGGSLPNRFIANEIETMGNISIRKQVAEIIVDTFISRGQNDDFSLILNKEYFGEEKGKLISDGSIASILNSVISIEQKNGLDFIQIKAESPSPYEAALLVNTYADVYRKFNLADTRKQVTRVKEFLRIQKDEKYKELLEAENKYKMYQLKGGAIQLDMQAQSLITKMSDLESKINETAVEKTITKETLDQLKAELKKKDSSLSKYLESKASEPYLANLQQNIAEIEAQRDYALISGVEGAKKKQLLQDFDNRLNSLKNNLKARTDDYKLSVITSSPEEIKEISNQIFEQEVKFNSLDASYNELLNYLKRYENRFDALPEATIDLARIERERISSEKLYLLLEEKYQEALINEQSTEGNVLILDYAYPSSSPSSPNRKAIILFGIISGILLGFGFALITDLFNKSVKTPEDIEKNNIEFLGWIPEISKFAEEPTKELIVWNNDDAISIDSFKALRTLLRHTKEGEPKSLLLTSSAPSEGKTLISTNLAATYALNSIKTVILDCDLRKPRTHTVFNEKRVPGFIDYLLGKVNLDDIVKETLISNLYLIPCGSIPENPTEILDSDAMKSLVNKLSEEYDMLVLDAPPLTILADSLILSKLVDKTILIAKANSTDINLLNKSVSLLRNFENNNFGGVVLNGFNLTKNYGSYYSKYSYTYSHYGSTHGKSKRKKNKENQKI